MKKNKRDKDKRDKALMTPKAGRKANSETPPPRSGSEEGKAKKKGVSHEPDEGDSDAHGGSGMGNFDKGQEGPQGYGNQNKV